jgi:hypothetical protein
LYGGVLSAAPTVAEPSSASQSAYSGKREG